MDRLLETNKQTNKQTNKPPGFSDFCTQESGMPYISATPRGISVGAPLCAILKGLGVPLGGKIAQKSHITETPGERQTQPW